MASMTTTSLVLVSLTATLPAQDVVPEGVRERVVTALDAANDPVTYEFRRQIYYVDYGCALGRSLVGHVDGTSPVVEDLVGDLLDFIAECADTDDRASAVLTDLGGEFVRVTAAGDRYLEEFIGPDGSVANATIHSGERKAVYVAKQDAVRLGTTKEVDIFTDPVDWLWPLPVGGEWKPAFDKSEWSRPSADAPGHVIAHIDRQGRRIDLHIDFAVSSSRELDTTATLPVRARAETTGRSTRGGSAAAPIVLIAWATDVPKPFITDIVNINLQEDVIRVTHVRRSDPRFDIEEVDVKLSVPRPNSVSIARNSDWSAFRRKDALPVAWRDLVSIED